MSYYPYSMGMPGREYSSPVYRYGFQGQERDDEVKGAGNSWNYKFRMHDPRVGSFFAVDPLAYSYPYNSPYAFSENQVIAFVELEGLEKAGATGIGGSLNLPNSGASSQSDQTQKAKKASDIKNEASEFTVNEMRGPLPILPGPIRITPKPPVLIPGSPKFPRIIPKWSPLVISPLTWVVGLALIVPGDTPIDRPSTRPGAKKFHYDPPNDPAKDDSDLITLYRGVGENVDTPYMYMLAQGGWAVPKGMLPQTSIDPHNDPDRHTRGDNNSIYTSWTLLESNAEKFALSKSKRGVIMKIRVHRSEAIRSALSRSDAFRMEMEVQLAGPRKALSVEYVTKNDHEEF